MSQPPTDRSAGPIIITCKLNPALQQQQQQLRIRTRPFPASEPRKFFAQLESKARARARSIIILFRLAAITAATRPLIIGELYLDRCGSLVSAAVPSCLLTQSGQQGYLSVMRRPFRFFPSAERDCGLRGKSIP